MKLSNPTQLESRQVEEEYEHDNEEEENLK